MSADGPSEDDTEDIEPADVRAELDRQRHRTGDSEVDEDIIDLFSRILDTDTRTRIYIRLRKQPHSSPEALAEGTGLYPGAVRRVLSDLHDEGVVERREPTSENGDPEYTAVGPNELVDMMAGQVQDEFERLFGLDRLFGGKNREKERTTEPVTIPVEKADEDDQ
ncbi:MAG TPA: winged helix-turn-helix domain-containing protein [Halococcus sp.]|nr:winged helix-turn-helix domain-containing protein [Halococcus sp.]